MAIPNTSLLSVNLALSLLIGLLEQATAQSNVTIDAAAASRADTFQFWPPTSWQRAGNVTQTWSDQSEVRFSFSGTEVYWFTQPSDDQTVVSFKIDNIPAGAGDAWSEAATGADPNGTPVCIWFAKGLEDKLHNVSVINALGDARITAPEPLFRFDHIAFNNGPAPVSTTFGTIPFGIPTNGGVSSGSSSDGSSDSDTTRKIIIGCVVGGVAILALLAFAFYWLRKRQNQSRSTRKGWGMSLMHSKATHGPGSQSPLRRTIDAESESVEGPPSTSFARSDLSTAQTMTPAESKEQEALSDAPFDLHHAPSDATNRSQKNSLNSALPYTAPGRPSTTREPPPAYMSEE